jgi:hypothetical protein
MSNVARKSSVRSAKRGKNSALKMTNGTTYDLSPGDVLAKLGKVLSKPGIDREVVFKSFAGKKVYAYSIDLKDTSRLVREDAEGKRTIGRFVGGKFRALTAAK